MIYPDCLFGLQSRIGELVQIQGQLDSSVNIVSASRELIRKGKLLTISPKNNKKVERLAYLVSVLLNRGLSPSWISGRGYDFGRTLSSVKVIFSSIVGTVF